MALVVKTLQANKLADLETAINDHLTDESVGDADLINVTVNDVKGQPTAVIVYKTT